MDSTRSELYAYDFDNNFVAISSLLLPALNAQAAVLSGWRRLE